MTVYLSALAGAGAQFFDDNGVPLSGGKLYSYRAGTTTPQTTYTSATGNTAHTNPIILNSAGRVSTGEIWLTMGQNYKFALKTSADVLLATWDNISGITSDANQISYTPATTSLLSPGPVTISAALDDITDINTGSSVVGFLPSGTNAVALTVQNKLKQIVNVKDFGAIGNGTTDDTVAINNAINYAISVTPSRLVFSSGTYRVTSALGPYTANDLEIDFGGATLDFSNISTSTSTVLLSFTGDYTTTTAALTTGLNVNEQTVACSTTGFSDGDMVRIYSNTVWDSTRTSTKIGELNFVDLVTSPSSLTIVCPAESNYTTAATATIQKLTPVKNITLRNGKIIAPAANDLAQGILISLGLNCSIQNMSTLDCDVYHIRLKDCILSTVSNCYIEEANNTTQAYGITCADACQDCLVTNNTIRNVRHGFTTNNSTSASYGITRRITVSDNMVYNNVPNVGGVSGDALDTHAGCEDISFLNNSIEGAYGIGINVEGRSAIVQGNNINGSTSSSIRFAPYADNNESEGIISNNVCQWVGDDTATDDYGIIVSLSTSTNCKRLVISGNQIHSKSEPIRIAGTTTAKFYEVVVSGNVCKLRPTGLTSAGVSGAEFAYCNDIAITGNVFYGLSRGALLQNCTSAAFTGNAVEITATSGSSAYAVWLDTTTHTSVTGNTLKFSGSGVTTTRGVFLNAGSTYSGVWSNVIKNFAAAGAAVFIDGSATGSVQAINIDAP